MSIAASLPVCPLERFRTEMPYLIGTDEAGYGPRLGPLLISISVWHVPRASSEIDLYDALSAGISSTRVRDDDKLIINDSKKLYHSGGSLRLLERGVLTCLGGLAAPDRWPTTWRNLWKTLTGTLPEALDVLPWYAGYEEDLPIDATAEEIEHLRSPLIAMWKKQQCKLVRFRTTAIFPEQLNRAIDELDSKAEVLTRATTALIADALKNLPPDSASIVCDKHGGRNYYLPAIQRQFPETLVQVIKESQPESRYQFTLDQQTIDICFRKGGESFLPAALASLASKLLRELAMRAWNRFWINEIPGLKPTAGYPADAVRFRQTVERRCDEAGLPLHLWWRMR